MVEELEQIIGRVLYENLENSYRILEKRGRAYGAAKEIRELECALNEIEKFTKVLRTERLREEFSKSAEEKKAKIKELAKQKADLRERVNVDVIIGFYGNVGILLPVRDKTGFLQKELYDGVRRHIGEKIEEKLAHGFFSLTSEFDKKRLGILARNIGFMSRKREFRDSNINIRTVLLKTIFDCLDSYGPGPEYIQTETENVKPLKERLYRHFENGLNAKEAFEKEGLNYKDLWKKAGGYYMAWKRWTSKKEES